MGYVCKVFLVYEDYLGQEIYKGGRVTEYEYKFGQKFGKGTYYSERK